MFYWLVNMTSNTWGSQKQKKYQYFTCLADIIPDYIIPDYKSGKKSLSKMKADGIIFGVLR